MAERALRNPIPQNGAPLTATLKAARDGSEVTRTAFSEEGEGDRKVIICLGFDGVPRRNCATPLHWNVSCCKPGHFLRRKSNPSLGYFTLETHSPRAIA